jgi:hypothetical protein
MIADLGRDSRMGNTLENWAIEVLNLGAPYNEESGEDMLDDRFDVSHSVMQVDTFRILDRARCIAVDITRNLLEDSGFNLINWYGAELLRRDLQNFRDILSRSSYQRSTEEAEVSVPWSTPTSLDLSGIQVD